MSKSLTVARESIMMVATLSTDSEAGICTGASRGGTWRRRSKRKRRRRKRRVWRRTRRRTCFHSGSLLVSVSSRALYYPFFLLLLLVYTFAVQSPPIIFPSPSPTLQQQLPLQL